MSIFAKFQVFKVKRHLDNKLFFLKCTAQSFDGSDEDLNKADILSEEIIAFNRFRHKCLLKGEACWFEVYNMNSTPETPSLSQPFDLYELLPQKCVSSLRNSNKNSSDMHTKNFLSAIFEISNKVSTVTDDDQMPQKKTVVVFSLLEHIPLTLQDILKDKGFQLTEDDKWHIGFHLASFFYFYHRHKHLHLQLDPRHVFIECNNVDSILMPKLLDYGVNMSCNELYSIQGLKSTSKYLPPEVSISSDDSTITLSADIFSLGLLFLQLFAHPATYDYSYIYNELMKGKTECLSQIVLPSDVVFLLEQMLTSDVSLRPEPSEILDYMIPFVSVDLAFDSDKLQVLIADRQHSDMLTHLVNTILYVELKIVEANVNFKKWLTKLPDSLFEAVLINRAKNELEKFLKDENFATRIDYEYLLNKVDDDEMPLCLRTLDLNDTDILKLVVYLVHKRYQLDDSDENPDVINLFNKLCDVLL